MNEKEKLAELINQAIDTYATIPLVNGCRPELKYFLADYLLANGVVVVDMNVVSPKNRPLISQCLGRPIDEIIELVNAKDEGRILALPCKEGDTVYEVCEIANAHSIHKCIGFQYTKNELQVITDDGFAKYVRTLKFSKEEAEKALAERSKRK